MSTSVKRMLGLAGALGLSALGTPVWEVAKPGLSAVARFFLGLLTLGSNSVRDAAYADAAMDPTALPTLHTLLILSAIQWGLLIASLTMVWLAPRKARPSAAVEESSKRMMRRVYTLLACLLLIAPFYLGQLLMTGQSLLIWRTFHTNLQICAPYLSDLEEKTLLARYAALTTRAEYLSLHETLRGVAAAHGVSLRSGDVW